MHPNRHTAIERNSGMLSSTEVTFFLHVGGCLEVSIYPWSIVGRLKSTGMFNLVTQQDWNSVMSVQWAHLVYNTTGFAECYKCQVGTHGDSMGLTECQKCLPGTFSNRTGLVD